MKIVAILNWLNEQNMEYKFFGDCSMDVSGFSSLSDYRVGSITWIKKEAAYNDAGRLQDITLAVVQDGVNVDFQNIISTPDSKEVFFAILHHFWGSKIEEGRIGKGTVISKNAIKHPTVSIGHNCTIDGNIEIGENSIIENNVVIQGNVRIGSNCIIHSGTVIGCDGYGYYFEDDGTIGKVEHFGGVVIGDQVEIGANTCIDRGTIDDTVIGFNSKIDNLVHIAHNVQIGKNVCVVAGAAICGSAKLEDGAYVAPGGIVKNQIKVCKNALVGLGAVATKTVEEEFVVAGVPAKPIRKYQKGDK